MKRKKATDEFLFFEKTSIETIIRNDLPEASETDIQVLLKQVEVAKVQERNTSEKAFSQVPICFH